MRRSAKRDRNESAIVGALLAHGLRVRRVNDGGMPDLLIRHRGQWHFAEVKTDAGRYTPAQLEFYAWAGEGAVPTLRTVDEAITWAKGLRA